MVARIVTEFREKTKKKRMEIIIAFWMKEEK